MTDPNDDRETMMPGDEGHYAPDPDAEKDAPESTRVVFAGQTASKRIALAELATRPDGEVMIVTKTFMPLPEGFREEFPDVDRGIFPGGGWEVLPKGESAAGTSAEGCLFKSDAYTLQYALWLIGALSAGIQAAGGWEQLRDEVTCMVTGEDGEITDVPLDYLIDSALKPAPAGAED